MARGGVMAAQLGRITITDVNRMSCADPERETRTSFALN
jgi:hypothetical protein